MAKTKTPSLVAATRDERGTSAARRLRRAGKVPAVLYGHGKENISLAVKQHALDGLLRRGAHGLLRLRVDDKPQNALIKDVQWNAMGDEVLHIDFIRVAKGETVTVEIPVTLRGEAPGVNEGGILEQKIYELELDCPVESIPEEIEINVNELHLGEEIKISDIQLPDECELHREEDEEKADLIERVLVEVSHPVEEPEEDEPVIMTGEEPELIDDKKSDEEGSDGDS